MVHHLQRIATAASRITIRIRSLHTIWIKISPEIRGISIWWRWHEPLLLHGSLIHIKLHQPLFHQLVNLPLDCVLTELVCVIVLVLVL